MPPGYVDDRLWCAEAVRVDNALGIAARMAGHRIVEARGGIHVVGEVLEQRGAVRQLEAGRPGPEGRHELLPRALQERLSDVERVVIDRPAGSLAPQGPAELGQREAAIGEALEDAAAGERTEQAIQRLWTSPGRGGQIFHGQGSVSEQICDPEFRSRADRARQLERIEQIEQLRVRRSSTRSVRPVG